MKRVIIVGSPRSNGRSAHLAEMLFEANIDERPQDELFLVPVSEIEVGFCIGCNACRQKTEVIYKDDDGNEVSDLRHRCVFDDDMQTVYDLLDEADALTVVSPVYFSGLPAPMKCIVDRLQPYFWEYRENGPRLPKRPFDLHVIGEGGDPHGYDALISEVKGPFALPGFGLERIYDWVGKISPEGEITEEALVREVGTQPAEQPGSVEADGDGAVKKPRPKLNLLGNGAVEKGSAASRKKPGEQKKTSGQQARTGGKGSRANNANPSGSKSAQKGARQGGKSASGGRAGKGKGKGTAKGGRRG